MKPLMCLCLLCLAHPAQAMTGDSQAIALARGMIEAMGGRDAWSGAKWMYAREDAWYAARPGPADAQFWRAVDRPAQRARVTGPGWSRESAWTPDSGYRIRDGVRTSMSAEDLQASVGWWRGEIYVMYVKLAREDANLRLITTGERSFRALDARDGVNLGEFFIDAAGALYRWKYGFGADAVEYIYGPLKSFGAIRAPSWGALSDGSFRFFYTDFQLSGAREPGEFKPPPR
jgi:hypothetical protein